jgi:hypothetical protein
MVHYHSLIRLYGAPNGLCSSITESKHIRAVKEPWRRSNRNMALGQMLVTNQRLDQLAAAHADFSNRGMFTDLDTPCKSSLIYVSIYIYIYIMMLFLVSSLSTTRTSLAPEPDDESSAIQVTDSICDEDPLNEAEPDTNAQPGVRLAAKPSQLPV